MQNETKENKEVVLVIEREKWPVLYKNGGLQSFIDEAKARVANVVADLGTAKGRSEIASMAATISRSKTAVEKPGRDYLRELKAAVKPAEEELRRFVSEMDRLRDDTRKPLTDWENAKKAKEQASADAIERIKALAVVTPSESSESIGLRIGEVEQLMTDERILDVIDTAKPFYQTTISVLNTCLEAAKMREEMEAQKAEMERIAAEEQRKIEIQKAVDAALALQLEQNAMKVAEARIEAKAEMFGVRSAPEEPSVSEQPQYEQAQVAEHAQHHIEQQAAHQAQQQHQPASEIFRGKPMDAGESKVEFERMKAVNRAALDDMISGGANEDEAKKIIKLIAKGLVRGVTMLY